MNITNSLIEKEIIIAYQNNDKLEDIALKFNKNIDTIRNIAKRNNIYISRLKKYSVNESFFEDVKNWNEEHAWILGWLASDGCNDLTKNRICLKLQERDKYILDTIKFLIKFDGRLYFRNNNSINPNWQNNYSLTITSKKLCKDLENLGIIQNKTFLYKFPIFLKKDLIRHFIRGYFEGDGHISKMGKDKSLSFHQIGTRNFLLEHNLQLNKQIGIPIKKLYKIRDGNEITHYYRIQKKEELYKLYHYLYDDCKYFLERKKKSFDIFIDYLINNKSFDYLNPIKV